MKSLAFTPAAARSLRKLPRQAALDLRSKLDRYAATGAGDVRALTGRPGRRLRAGDYRALFIETSDTIEVFAPGHRRDIYE